MPYAGALMSQSRLSLSTLMILVVPLAVDLLAFRSIIGLIVAPVSDSRGAYCLLGLLPILTASFLGLYFLAKSLRTCGRAGSFAVGFVATTFVAALAFTVVCCLGFRPGSVMAYLQPLAPVISDANAPTWVPILLIGYSAVVSVPQFLVAVAGGCLFHHYGVTLNLQLKSPSASSASAPASTAKIFREPPEIDMFKKP